MRDDRIAIYPSIGPAVFKEKTTRKYRKHPRLVMFEGGRYGTRWLRRLVYQAAANLGMLGHDRSFEEMTTVAVRTISKDCITETISAAILAVMHASRYTPDDLEIVIGQDQFPKLRAALSRDIAWTAPINIAKRDPYGEIRYRGIRVRLVPFMTGFAVIPREGARG